MSFQGFIKSDFWKSNLTKAKTAPFGTVFIKWCAIVCDYRTEYYNEYNQLGDKLKRFSDHDEDMNAKDLQLKILDI